MCQILEMIWNPSALPWLSLAWHNWIKTVRRCKASCFQLLLSRGVSPQNGLAHSDPYKADGVEKKRLYQSQNKDLAFCKSINCTVERAKDPSLYLPGQSQKCDQELLRWRRQIIYRTQGWNIVGKARRMIDSFSRKNVLLQNNEHETDPWKFDETTSTSRG